MRHYDPNSASDIKEAVQLNAPAWMLDVLAANTDYTYWGDDDDETSGEYGLASLETDELNEIVNFYFDVNRASETCPDCEGSGYNPETHRLDQTFYHEGFGKDGWGTHLTTDEIEMLEQNGRGSIRSHDAINRWMLVEHRAKRLGVWGECPKCSGEGEIYTAEHPTLDLHVWKLLPRKGVAVTFCVSDLKQEQLPEVYVLLRKAADRNASRFSKIPVITPIE